MASTEMPITIVNDVSGYIHTDVDFLITKMKHLLDDPQKAKQLGDGAKSMALSKFGIERFKSDWLETFNAVLKSRLEIEV